MADTRQQWEAESNDIVKQAKATGDTPFMATSILRPRNFALWWDTTSGKYGEGSKEDTYDAMMANYSKKLDSAVQTSQQSSEDQLNAMQRRMDQSGG